MVRRWQPRELRLTAEYLNKEYPGAIHMLRVRLGGLHPVLKAENLTEREKRLLSPFKRWADAIVIKADEMVLIEVAIMPEPGDVSKLELYARLVRHTPELEQYRSRPLVLELVYAIEDPLVVVMARERNIRVRYFRPKWVDDYLLERAHRMREAPATNPDEYEKRE